MGLSLSLAVKPSAVVTLLTTILSALATLVVSLLAAWLFEDTKHNKRLLIRLLSFRAVTL